MSALGEVSNELWDYIHKKLGTQGMLDAAQVFVTRSIDQKTPKLDQKILMDVAQEGLFVEWLWFEWHIKGRSESILQSFSADVRKLLPDARRHLDQLLATNHYGLYRVGNVKPGNIELTDLQSGTNYHVREYSMAKSVRPGDCIFLRVAQQDEHWEIISPDGAVPINLPQPEDAFELTENMPEQLSIKDSFSYAYLLRSLELVPEKMTSPVVGVPLDKARELFDQMLERTHLNEHITRERVEELMIEERASPDAPSEGLPIATRLLLGLNEGRDQQGLTNDVMEACSILWNSLPHTAPHKKRPKQGSSVEAYRVDLIPWREQVNEAHLAMKLQDASKATAAWGRVYDLMLEAHGTTASLFRYYANTALSYLIDGNSLLGRRLLEISLELYPEYDFALDQLDRVRRGEYDYYIEAKLAERYTKGNLNVPPSFDELTALSDTALMDRFAAIGHDVDKNSFRRLTKKHRTADAVAVKTWGIDPDKREVDIAEALLVEANRRWSADQPWPDTLTSVAFELNSEARPSVEGERKNLRKAQLLFQELGQLMPAADNRAIRDWIGERYDYYEVRENLVYDGLELMENREESREILKTFFKVAYGRTKDPIYLVPGALADARHGKHIDSIIVSIAKELPLDNLALGVLADELPDAMVRQKEKAYLLALAAIDRRHEKGLRTYQPYSRTSLQEDYLWILDGLCGVYEASGQEDRAEGYHERYMQIAGDDNLAQLTDETAEELAANRVSFIDKELFPENPALRYYSWFKTLGISLEHGDGIQTTQTVTEVESGISKKLKVVRNDPCPCGKLKPDGTPVKYKKCHGVGT